MVYQGAFRLPEGSNDTDWAYSGNALAYYPEGDPDGPADGYPGSLFGTGHDWYQQVSEVSIPVPVISPSKNPGELNTAETLQPFHDVTASLNIGQRELLRAGLAYLPPQGTQTRGKLHFCWGEHYQDERVVSHGSCELDLAHPQTAGGWYIGEFSNYSTDDYLFEIPPAWAAAHTPACCWRPGGFATAAGRARAHRYSRTAPGTRATPPPPNAELRAVPLILYTASSDFEAEQHTMNDYHHSDEWSGGAWLTAGDKSSVVFVGTKGVGDCWYGFANGVVWPDEPPYPPIPDPPNDGRGWWSTEFVGRIIFYNPADLAAVARGDMPPHEPQPYASLDVDQHLFGVRSNQQMYHLGAASFDRARGLLYVFEHRGRRRQVTRTRLECRGISSRRPVCRGQDLRLAGAKCAPVPLWQGDLPWSSFRSTLALFVVDWLE